MTRLWLRVRPRSLRGRLTGASLVAAAVLLGLGGLLFRFELHRGLLASVDNGLTDRAAVLATAIRAGQLPQAPVTAASSPLAGPESITAVYDPAGRLVRAEPAGFADVPSGLRRGSATVTRVVDGRELRLLAMPVPTAEGTWQVVVGADDDALHASDHEIDATVVIAGLAVFAVTVAGAWLLTGSALRPVETMRRDVAAIGESGRQVGEPDDAVELASLARTLNHLLRRLHDSLTRQRELVADAGHELRTPLAVLTVELELADRDSRTPAELRDAIAHARSEVGRLTALSEDLLTLAAADSGRLVQPPIVTPVRGLLEDVARAHAAAAGRAQVRIELDADDSAPVIDPAALRRALDNLVTNALRYAESVITLHARTTDGTTVIDVTDDGPGFDPAFQPHAFERFRRADDARGAGTGGSGLGLAIVASVAEAHGGTASVLSPTRGARVQLRLPG